MDFDFEKIPICPNCGKKLEVMYVEQNKDKKFDCLCHCENCINGISFDWKVVYSPEDGYANFERHFWG